ncbi:cation diffusion facilitator family transporter [Carnimonas bestiolae]|uniref:cation diffusion facilitator family transporter n=1 Tax=Carnimonas bestiolae TaxID=3402172 RepID=UPI003EDC44EF
MSNSFDQTPGEPNRHRQDSHPHHHDDHAGHEHHAHGHSGHAHHAHGGHGHHHGHVHDVTKDSEHRVMIALAITGIFMAVEIIVGLTANSLALVSDGIHMLSDAFSLGLALAAFRLGRRPADSKRSYGYQRMQVLAAFSNGLVLVLLSLAIGYEAIKRVIFPEDVAANSMLVVAIIGLCVNALSFWILEGGDKHNLNMRGAALHVMGDLLGSVAAIAAAIIIMLTGFTAADPLLSLLACVLILRGAVRVLKSASHLLLEGTPENIDSAEVREALEQLEGVTGVHDLHLWGLTEREVMLSAHLAVSSDTLRDEVLQRASRELQQRFGIGHATLQVEGEEHASDCDCHASGVLHP